MKRTISFGKIDFNHSHRRNCEVDVRLELRDTEQGPEFSACGNVWNPLHTDTYCGGQCLDTIARYVHTPLFKEIHRLWRAHHLNSLHAGTEAQERALDNIFVGDDPSFRTYERACDVLKQIGLYDDNGNIYGHKWYYRAIPDEDLALIKKIIEKGEL